MNMGIGSFHHNTKEGDVRHRDLRNAALNKSSCHVSPSAANIWICLLGICQFPKPYPLAFFIFFFFFRNIDVYESYKTHLHRDNSNVELRCPHSASSSHGGSICQWHDKLTEDLDQQEIWEKLVNMREGIGFISSLEGLGFWKMPHQITLIGVIINCCGKENNEG